MMGEEFKWITFYTVICNSEEAERIIMVVFPELEKKNHYQETQDY